MLTITLVIWSRLAPGRVISLGACIPPFRFAHPTYLEPDDSVIVEAIVNALPEHLERNVKRNEFTNKYNRAETLESPLPLVGEPELTMAGDYVVRFTDNPETCVLETIDSEALDELSLNGKASWDVEGTLGLAFGEVAARVTEHEEPCRNGKPDAVT